MAKATLAAVALLFLTVILLVPSQFRLPVAATAGLLGFGLYALRVRAALRHLRDLLKQLLRRADDQAILPSLLGTVDRRIDELEKSVARVEEAVNELASARGATTSELVRRHDSLAQDLRQQVDGLRAEVTNRLGRVATQAELARVQTAGLAAVRRESRQVEALLSLYSSFRVRAPLPPSRGWALSPDALLHLTTMVLERRPRLVVELGSGLSTVWMCYALEKAGSAGRVISFDHDATFADKTRRLLVRHGLSDLAEVRHAPLVNVEVEGKTWTWYSPDLMTDIKDCDLLFVDGPPGGTGARARYPALPILADRLAQDAIVILDDYLRDDEKHIVEAWLSTDSWDIEILNHEKGTAVLTRS